MVCCFRYAMLQLSQSSIAQHISFFTEKDVLEILAEVRATKKAAEIMVEESAPKRLKLND